jgi:hypothetical protein
MSLSQMQIGCLPGSQIGLTSMQRDPVGTGAGMEPGPVLPSIAAVATKSPAHIDLRIRALPRRDGEELNTVGERYKLG